MGLDQVNLAKVSVSYAPTYKVYTNGSNVVVDERISLHTYSIM